LLSELQIIIGSQRILYQELNGLKNTLKKIVKIKNK
jgi:hypothetical protein